MNPVFFEGRLQANAGPAIRAHLDAMTSEDRFTRFGFNVTPDGLDHYTNAINFNRDVVIGAHYRDLLIRPCCTPCGAN